MIALRSLLVHLWGIITVLPWTIAVMLASIFVHGTPLYRLGTAWVKLAMLPGAQAILGIHNRATGQQNIPSGPAVFLVKHQSAWETLMLPCFIPQPLSYVFKRELLSIPFFGWAMARLDFIHINRGRHADAFTRVLQQGQQFLAQGNGVVMFPEGTRTPRGQRGHYHNGGARLAISAGVPVVPVAVASARCWPKGLIKRPGVVDFSFGPPISSAGKRPGELMGEVADWIETEMRRIDPDAYPVDQAPDQAIDQAAGQATPGSAPDAPARA
jgi:1-acyl-sn-glycerol-3-phosphate acyltransferase